MSGFDTEVGARLLHEISREGPPKLFDCQSWQIQIEHHSILFGDGGTAKSYLTLWLAGLMARRGAKVLYVDWELTGPTHSERLGRLFGSNPPPVYYLPGRLPIIKEVARIRREIQKHGIEFAIFDSAGYATEGAPESAENAVAFYRAVKQLGVPGSLTLAHITKAGEPAEMKPFGSVFWHNSVTATWFIKMVEESEGRLVVRLINRKGNIGGRLLDPVLFELGFTAEDTAITVVDEVTTKAKGAESLVQRVVRVLEQEGELTYEGIVARAGGTVAGVKKAIGSRHRTKFVSRQDPSNYRTRLISLAKQEKP